MNIRKAEEKDIPRLLALLGQVLQIHAEIRPDIFIPGTTKYTVCELTELLKHEDKPIYVAVNEDDVCMGYAFCQLKEQPFSTNMVPFKSLFIDDLCIDKQARGQHIGESLFDYVKQQAKALGCYEVTLNVCTIRTKNVIHKAKEMLEQYRAVAESEEYKASPAYRLQEYLKQFQRESGYNDVFIPAMQRLSPAYREYHKSLQAANEVFLRHFQQE